MREEISPLSELEAEYEKTDINPPDFDQVLERLRARGNPNANRLKIPIRGLVPRDKRIKPVTPIEKPRFKSSHRKAA